MKFALPIIIVSPTSNTEEDTYVWYTAEKRSIAKAFDEKLQEIRLLVLSMDDVLLLQSNRRLHDGQVL